MSSYRWTFSCRRAAHESALQSVRRNRSRRSDVAVNHTIKAVPDNAAPAAAPAQPKQYLYEPRFGLPVVRRQLSYSELLKSTRQGKVKSVSWFKADHKGTAVVDGPCLVEFIDGTLYQSNVPMEEVRIRYAMETHGVTSHGLPTMPTPSELTPYQGFPFQSFVELAIKYLPFLGFLMIWAAVQFKDILKGDFTDRSQVRKKERSDADAAKVQAREDDKILGLQKMVVNNMDEAAVRKEIARLKLDIEEEELQAMLADARRLRARQEQGGWALQEEEEENVRKRQAELKGEQQRDSVDVNKMRGLRIRKARLRSVNRTRLKGKLKNVEDDEVFFDDVAGIDMAKQELSEIVDFFNFPERYAKSGARSPRGCLLYGPPGTGKTLLARAVAGEANATFLGVNASEFVEMFIGVGAARVRDLFATARENAPAVVFIDEIDAVGRVRGGSVGNDERDQTLNQMLSEMDGFDARSGVVVIAATNRRDILDPALIRPGRFDRQVYVGPPSREGRIDVLHVHLRKFQWKPETIDIHDLAFSTDGYTGAMLSNLCNVAALMANRNGRDAITGDDFRMALQYEHQGLPAGRHTPAVTRRIAVLEAATAVTASLLPAIEPVEYVYTQPTEKRKLGSTVLQDNEQRSMTELYTKQYLEEQLRVVLAGRAAERLLLGEDEVSSLNMDNINHARDIVHMIVLGAAMGDNPRIGPQMLSQPNLTSELSSEVQMSIGPATSVETLTEAQFQMQDMLKQAEHDAFELLQRNRGALEQVIDKLCSEPYEMSGDEVRAIVHDVGNADDLRALQESVASFL